MEVAANLRRSVPSKALDATQVMFCNSSPAFAHQLPAREMYCTSVYVYIVYAYTEKKERARETGKEREREQLSGTTIALCYFGIMQSGIEQIKPTRQQNPNHLLWWAWTRIYPKRAGSPARRSEGRQPRLHSLGGHDGLRIRMPKLRYAGPRVFFRFLTLEYLNSTFTMDDDGPWM